MNSMKDMLGDTLATYPSAPGFQRHSATSRNAANSMQPHYSAQQKKIIEYLTTCGATGAIYDEIAEGTGLLTASVCGRLVELAHAGRVVKGDTRPSASNRPARIYLLKEFATQGERHE